MERLASTGDGKAMQKGLRENRKELRSGLNVFLLIPILLIVLIVLLGIEYLIISGNNRDKAYDTADIMVNQVETMMEDNEAKIKTLTESLKDSYISKAKAVAYIIDNNPGTDMDIDELKKIARLMSIDEIHVFDDTGMIYSGTVPEYYYYSFDSGEQMAYFKPMLDDKEFSMCQDVTPNTAEEKAMMYAITWNDAGDKMIQVGIEPDRLLEELRSSEISDLLGEIPSYDGMTILVADAKTTKILGSTVSEQVGKKLADLGITKKLKASLEPEHFTSPVDGVSCYCASRVADGRAVLIAQDRNVINRDIPVILLTVFIYLLLAAIVIGLIIRRMTRRIFNEHLNASTDMLTGLLNRRACDDDLKKLEGNPKGETLTMVSLDLNGLKTVNDEQGHEAGDELLCEAADCMASQLGPYGKVYRMGGDEFFALLQLEDTSPEELKERFDRDQQERTERTGMELSISAGIVQAADHPDLSLTELSKLADDEMYRAKSEYYRQKGIDRRKRTR